MTFKNKMISALIISLILLVIVFQSSNLRNNIKELTIIKMPIENCMPQERICNIKINDIEVSVSFEKEIFYLKPFKVSLFSENKNSNGIDAVYIDFKMRNMDMGVNRFLLSGTDSKNNKQNWQGKALLPICVTGRADWYSELEIIIDKKKYIVSFPLTVMQAAR